MPTYRFVLVAVLCILLCVQQCYSHSWLACTDYAEKNGHYYSHDLCRGYARSAISKAPITGTFGADTGFDHQPMENSPCKTARNDATEYDADHPMAVYYQGQQVVLAHPMKNHGSDSCTNRFIPDTGNFIYRGGLNDASDLTLSGFRSTLVADLGVKDDPDTTNDDYLIYPKPGYQNAPAFCENTDKSLGTYSFNVPSDLTPGQYTFYWLWMFNSDTNLYSSCFEVKIVETLAERNAILTTNGYTNFYEPCGGLTSNFAIPGNTNPGCTDDNADTTTTTTTTTIATSTAEPTTASTTTTTASGETSVVVNALQMGGEISLPQAESGTLRRYVSVQFDCPVTANFWNIRVIDEQTSGDSVHYDLMQEGSDMDAEKFYYHAMFSDACDINSYPPTATLISDEM